MPKSWFPGASIWVWSFSSWFLPDLSLCASVVGVVGAQSQGALGEALPLFHMTTWKKEELEEGRELLGRQAANNSCYSDTLFLEEKLPQL